MKDVFVLYSLPNQASKTVAELKQSPLINKIYLLTADASAPTIEGCELLLIDRMESSDTVRQIAKRCESDYALIVQQPTAVLPGYFALERMVRVAQDSGAGMVYADHYLQKAAGREVRPLIDYQEGSLRDDFDFGAMVLYNAEALKRAADEMRESYRFAGLYDLRLRVSRSMPLVRVNEYLYTTVEEDARLSGEKIFDYVDPRNREVQVEMELACTAHLKAVGGYLEPDFKSVDLNVEGFKVEASVIIPVRNRVRTLAAAIESVLMQETNFQFNLIVVDNHSDDGTTELIQRYADDERLLHLIPERDDLGIGGCWNWGVHHEACGKFAVQLDSDDLYSGVDTLQKIVDVFYAEQCAMVVGSYQMTNFDLEEIPPGVIDHREWTPDNGRNNALRINGLGAPRAFFTPVLREVKVPNTSYGEDYALGLNISRHYQIGRVYDVVYLCRRWEDNTDAALDVVKMNGHNLYKDRLRTWELQARIKMNGEGE